MALPCVSGQLREYWAQKDCSSNSQDGVIGRFGPGEVTESFQDQPYDVTNWWLSHDRSNDSTSRVKRRAGRCERCSTRR